MLPWRRISHFTDGEIKNDWLSHLSKVTQWQIQEQNANSLLHPLGNMVRINGQYQQKLLLLLFLLNESFWSSLILRCPITERRYYFFCANELQSRSQMRVFHEESGFELFAICSFMHYFKGKSKTHLNDQYYDLSSADHLRYFGYSNYRIFIIKCMIKKTLFFTQSFKY